MFCTQCSLLFWEDHIPKTTATCTQRAVCYLCGRSYGETAPHDLVQHEAKDAACTEDGRIAYETCRSCDYSTYKAIPALEHDLVHHAGKAAACTETGWDAYDTCSRCDYTTYKELPALEHDYKACTAKPICTEDGCTRHACTRCGDTFTDRRWRSSGTGSASGFLMPTARITRSACARAAAIPARCSARRSSSC